MREVGTIIGGIGLLIFAYLAFSNSNAVTSIADSFAKDGTGLISTLQGRAA